MNWFALHVEVSSQSLSNKIIMRKKLIKFLFTAGNNLKKEKELFYLRTAAADLSQYTNSE